MASITILCHPLSRPSARVVDEYVRCAAAKGDDAVALLVPTMRLAEEARAAMIAHGRAGLYDPRIYTFPQLAEAILIGNHHPFSRISELQRELLLLDVLRQAGVRERLGLLEPYLARPSSLPGLIGAIASVLDDIKRCAVEPADFANLVRERLPGHPANDPICAIYETYQQRLVALKLYDEPGLFWEALRVLREGRRRPLETVSLLLVDGFFEFTTTQLLTLQQLCEGVERAVITLCLEAESGEEDRGLTQSPPDVAAQTRAHEPGVAPDSADPGARPMHSKPGAVWHRETDLTGVAGLREVFTLTAETLSRLQQVLAEHDLRVEFAGRHNDAELTNLDVVQARVFATDSAEIGVADGTVRVLGVAGGTQAEAREVARRVKGLLLDTEKRVEPYEVAVVVRELDEEHDRALRHAFGAYGIPCEVSRGQPLARNPAVRAVLGVLDVVAGDWQRADVVKLLGNSYVDTSAIRPSEAKLSAHSFERVALAARIIGGREAWARRLHALGERLGVEHRRRAELEKALGIGPESTEARAALEDEEGVRLRPLADIERENRLRETCAQVVGKLQELLEPLEHPRDLAHAVAALGEIIQRLGIVKRARADADTARASRDLAALEALGQALRELGEAPRVLQVSAEITAEDFCLLVRRICQITTLPEGGRFGGAVQVLDAHEVRGLRFRHVFVPGLSEGAFPIMRRQDPFYHDDDRRRLGRDTPVLEPRSARQAEEAILFYAVLCAAEETIWLSYPTSDAEGSPLLRSYYVDEVMRQFAPGVLAEEVTDLSGVIRPPLEACSRQELLEAAFHATAPRPAARGWAGTAQAASAREAARGLGPDTFRRIEAAARVERARISPQPPGPFEGCLEDPEIRELLKKDALFGTGHLFSASQLGRYGECPAKFFFSDVLGLKALDEPTEDIQAVELGLLVHRILANFFGGYSAERVGRDKAGPLRPDAVEQRKAQMSEVVAAVFQTAVGAGIAQHRRLWDLARSRVERDLHRMLEWEAEQNAKGAQGGKDKSACPPRTVWATEHNYGKNGDVGFGEGEDRVLVWGRIDRIDVLTGRNQFVVFDYKTGRVPRSSAIRRGEDFQLPLYCLAVQQLSLEGPEPQPFMWAYYRVTRPVRWHNVEHTADILGNDDSQGLLRIAQDNAVAHVRRIRSGEFSVPQERTDGCRQCDFRIICRRR